MSEATANTCPNGDTCQLDNELTRLREEVEHLKGLVSTDPLTSLYNYRYFIQSLEQEIERSLRTAQPTSLIMVDIDYFKKVNDNWGHEVGNQALKLISQCILKNIRKLDVACRYGGEEFAIILPSSDIGTSARVAERIRHSIESTPLHFIANNGEETQLDLTASAGLTSYSGNHSDNTPFYTNSLVSAADEQLYRAKKEGRNRICYHIRETPDQQVSAEEKSALFTIFDEHKNTGH